MSAERIVVMRLWSLDDELKVEVAVFVLPTERIAGIEGRKEGILMNKSSHLKQLHSYAVSS